MRIDYNQKKVWVVLTAVVAVVVLAVGLPSYLHVARLRAQVGLLQRQVVDSQHSATAVNKLKAQIAELNEQASQFARSVPNSTALGPLLEQLSIDLASASMTSQEIAAKPIVEAEGFNRIPLTLACRGFFKDVFGLLQRIESYDRLVRVDRLQIDSDAEVPGQPLIVRMELSTFAAGTGGGR